MTNEETEAGEVASDGHGPEPTSDSFLCHYSASLVPAYLLLNPPMCGFPGP